MISFLITMDKTAKIIDIIWSDPVYIVSQNQLFLSELFSVEDQVMLAAMIERSLNESQIFSCEHELRLVSAGSKISLCMLRARNSILLFASDMRFVECLDDAGSIREVIHKFMYVIKDFIESDRFHNHKSVNTEFNKIQALNNELINTRRLLEKANAQARILNEELNNRLVKDALTGLISRYQYRMEIDLLIASDPEKFGFFVFMDIDNFKSVNDTYGHAIGDQYLSEFAERVKKLPIERTIRMRISGDEFGLFTYGLADVDAGNIQEIWEQIKTHVIFGPIETESGPVPLSISAGVAIYGKDTRDIYELIEYADFAMYIAKRAGKNGLQVFDKSQYKRHKG
jgi:diguanylate cyclase (GGDEF)-like protein